MTSQQQEAWLVSRSLFQYHCPIRNQGSLEKWMILELGQEMHKTRASCSVGKNISAKK
jgi:hypothetical protein